MSDNLALTADTVSALAARLPDVAERCVAAIVEEVPAYTRALSGAFRGDLERAVQFALSGFLRRAAHGGDEAPRPIQGALEGAHTLGQGEARSGRSMDALLAAYRVGARVAWRELSETSVQHGVDAMTLARFAELVFTYIDDLSAASVTGHAEELAAVGRVREQRRERLAAGLLARHDERALRGLADRADWSVPETLTAVIVDGHVAGSVAGALGRETLRAPEDPAGGDLVALLVPDSHGPGRQHVMRVLAGRPAYVGPARQWTDVATSYDRASRVRHLVRAVDGPVDTESHLSALVLRSDPESLADLRIRALAPLADLRPATAARLAETLLAWLLHQGRRDDVAAMLHVHPQTVRYRMSQVRDLYGERLYDADQVKELLVALLAGPVPSPHVGQLRK